MKRSLKNYLAVAGFALAILAVCAVACTVTALWVIRSHDAPENHDHYRVHEELGLKEGDHEDLDKLEEPYLTERNKLVGEMQVLKAELSKQLLTKTEADEELYTAVTRIHATHGKLQELSIQHYFDMLSILPEAKQRRLRELAANSLSEPP